MPKGSRKMSFRIGCFYLELVPKQLLQSIICTKIYMNDVGLSVTLHINDADLQYICCGGKGDRQLIFLLQDAVRGYFILFP